MKAKIFILAFAAFYQVAMAQRPTVLPISALGSAGVPAMGSTGIPAIGSTGFPPFLGAFNNNWVRPYYAAAAEGWRTYFEQLQQARNQLYQTLTNLQNTAQNTSATARDTIAQILSTIPLNTNRALDDDETHQILGDLQPPTAETPAHDVPQEIQVVQTITRPQVQSDVPKTHTPVTVTHTVTQTQPNRQPQTLGLQGVTTATRPVTSQVGSGAVPQVTPQIVPQVGGQIIPQVGTQVPSWVGK